MKYYVIADPHGFYAVLRDTLEKSGFFNETQPSKLVILGDLLDRGEGAVETVDLMLELLKKDQLIYIRGNHEDLLENLLDDCSEGNTWNIQTNTSHHIHNGTWNTALQLSGMAHWDALGRPDILVKRVRASRFYQRLLPAAVDFFETEHYVFTHGYIPCRSAYGNSQYARYKAFFFNPQWREASEEEWRYARWYNGMEFACQRNLHLLDKTVVCGHYTCSYGHVYIEKKPREGDGSADYEPFYGKAKEDTDGRVVLIALDACTKVSGKMNCLVLED